MLRLRPLDLAWGGKTGLFLTAYSGTLWLEHVGKDGLQEETRLVLAGENEALGQVAVAGKVEAQDDAVFVFAEFAATPPAAWKVVGDEASFIEDQSVVDKVFGQQRIVQRPIGIAVQTRPATAELSARPRAMELEAETAYVQQVPSAATDTGATTVVWVLCIVAAGLCVAVWLSRRRSRRRSSSP
jgi:hypothetical protein